jgi:S1-C subfamily serine protease
VEESFVAPLLSYTDCSGPLLNARGEVIGTNTWGDDTAVSENNGYAIGIPTLCLRFISCEATFDWEEN